MYDVIVILHTTFKVAMIVQLCLLTLFLVVIAVVGTTAAYRKSRYVGEILFLDCDLLGHAALKRMGLQSNHVVTRVAS